MDRIICKRGFEIHLLGPQEIRNECCIQEPGRIISNMCIDHVDSMIAIKIRFYDRGVISGRSLKKLIEIVGGGILKV